MVLCIVFEKLAGRVTHFGVAVQPMLNLLLGNFRPETRTITHALIVSRITTVVVIKEHVEPEGHLVAIMLGGPVVCLLQRGHQQLFVCRRVSELSRQ